LGWTKGSEMAHRKPQNMAQPSSVVFGEKRVSVWEKSGERMAGAALLAEKLGNVLGFVVFLGAGGGNAQDAVCQCPPFDEPAVYHDYAWCEDAAPA
jgi:hypothetical protein